MKRRDLAMLLALAALWGGSFVFIRVASPALGPVWVAEARVTIAFVTLLLYALASARVPDLRARWKGYLIVGIINSALPFALYCFAELYISATTAAILNATSPLFGAAFAAAFLGELLNPRKLLGMLIGLSGVVVVVGWQSGPMQAHSLLAALACLAAALCYGLAGVYAKLRMAGTTPFAIALYSQLGAALFLLPGVALSPLPTIPDFVIAANVAALGVLGTAVAFLLYFRLIDNVGPTKALTVTYLIPVFGALWSSLFLHEALTPEKIVGCLIVLAGTAMTVLAPTRTGQRLVPVPRET